MNRPPLPPAQIIKAACQRPAKATSAAGIEYANDTAIGAVNGLEDLRLIDMDTWRATCAEFDNLADSRRALTTAGSAQ
jgi:hypothetical protein